ncbi:hypothetical protein [Bradyrhizobium sp. SZCCHNR2009]|uniref:PBECR3 domain-containing polyvalent protein n=1 Tax=Bradyrhizobium sp. SZCCHNR2009 TaxID=3057375 RepID=UPI0028F14836|nr:hypothetical protein [Bradyrhizobium sp. SZCCHNR2009]
MAKHRPPKTPDLIIGPMPVTVVNKTLGTELEVGDVILSRGAQRHANRRHPEDYPKCLPHLASVIASPRYIGDDHTNSGIEIWGYVAALGALVLVAIELIPDAQGRYHISSFYIVSERKADARRLKGFLKVALL